MIRRDWYGAYSENWNGEIVPDAYAHPAKFARGLIRRIYEHALEQGYLSPGDVVLDPFGGVALGACDSISRGLNWVGVELEQKFVDLGNQNIDRWHLRAQHAETMGLDWGRAQLVQGDSRELARIILVQELAELIIEETRAMISSPPYADGAQHTGGKTRMTSGQGGLIRFVDYGQTPGQLANLPEGTPPDALVSSPPYADGCRHTGGDDPNPEYVEGGKLYGVGISGAVSSPPYAESVGSDDPDKRGGLYRDPKRANDKTLTTDYGDSAGQLGRMRVVSSPPYEASYTNSGGEVAYTENERAAIEARSGSKLGGGQLANSKRYGASEGQLGTETGSDFWTAARQIMQQVYQVLPPGAYAIWVTKRFVRDKRIVDFSQQWAALGESCGFETVEWIRAWLIEDRGQQYDLFGGLEQKQVKRASFFRRLYESKYPENSIDWEDVIIQRRLA